MESLKFPCGYCEAGCHHCEWGNYRSCLFDWSLQVSSGGFPLWWGSFLVVSWLEDLLEVFLLVHCLWGNPTFSTGVTCICMLLLGVFSLVYYCRFSSFSPLSWKILSISGLSLWVRFLSQLVCWCIYDNHSLACWCVGHLTLCGMFAFFT